MIGNDNDDKTYFEIFHLAPTTTSVSPFPSMFSSISHVDWNEAFTFVLHFLALQANLACQTGVFNTSWAVVGGTSMSAGSSLSQLSSPTDVFIDGNFNLYIADTSNSRIQRYRPGKRSYLRID